MKEARYLCLALVWSALMIVPIRMIAQGTQPSAVERVHHIPLGSDHNLLELAVANGSSGSVAEVYVSVGTLPPWLHVSPREVILPELAAGGSITARFTLSVDKSAPPKREQTLRFSISTPNGEEWDKEISIAVAEPTRFELFQNYPNPFNPETIIGYMVSQKKHVTLHVYNLLGQELYQLVDEVQEVGYHTVNFNASGVPSGVYFYRLQTDNVLLVKTMVLTR